MPGTTTIYGWPYQELADAPDGPNLGQDLADAIETTVDSIDDRVDALEIHAVQHAYTTATLSTPLSAAWGNVTGFSFAAVAGRAYGIDCVLFCDNPSSSAPDIRFGWTWTGTGAMTSGQRGVDVNTVAPAYNGVFTAHALINDTVSPLDENTGLGTPAAIPVVHHVAATYVCTADGTVQLRFAQASSDASFASRVLHGSRMRAERIV